MALQDRGTGTAQAELPLVHPSPINRRLGAFSDQTLALLMGAAAALVAGARAPVLLMLRVLLFCNQNNLMLIESQNSLG